MRNIALAIITTALISGAANAGERIRAVGSSTVFPFVAAAAERFGEKTEYDPPIIESTGTGAGMIEFCKGAGADFPDIVNASRPMVATEREMCAENNVGEIVEIPLGKDGIVIASAKTQDKPFSLTHQELFLALAKDVPVNGELVANPHQQWHEINPELPETRIEVYGPKSTSGTRDAFVELVMEEACADMEAFEAAYPAGEARQKACHMIREDGHYIEAGENDNLIVQKLALNKEALGVFGYSFLEQNMDKVVGHPVNGVAPTFDSIASGEYPVARSLFVYVKQAHIAMVDALKPFLRELTSEMAISGEGYLALKGLIPYPFEKRQEIRDAVEAL